MSDSDFEIREKFSNTKMLAALAASGIPVLVSGRVAEKFHGCVIIPTSIDYELILKPDLNCAVGFTKVLGKPLRDFGLQAVDAQDAVKLSTSGFRFKPFPTSEGIDILVAESGEVFDEMQGRSTAADIDGLILQILSVQDIFYLKKNYAEHWHEKYLKHLADLQRLEAKLTSQS